MQVVPVLSVFSTGELSPLYAGRVDLPAYYKGCSQLENFLLMRQGGVTRRPGTYHVATALYDTSTGDASLADANNRFIPWIVNDTKGFAIEVAITGAMTDISSSGYAMRFFKSTSHSLVTLSFASTDPFYISLPTFGATWNLVADSYDLTAASWESVDCTSALSDEYYRGKRFTELTRGSPTTPCYIWQSLTFTSNGPKTIQGIMRKGGTANAGIELYDTSAATTLGEVFIGFRTKNVYAIEGALQQAEWLDDNTVFVAFETDSIVTANQNTLRVFPGAYDSLTQTAFATEIRALDFVPSVYVGQGVWDAAWAGYWDYQHIQVRSTMYFVHERSPIYKLTKYGADDPDFSLSEVSMAGTPFTDMYKTPRTIGFEDDSLFLGGSGDDSNKLWKSVVGSHEDFSLGALSDQGMAIQIATVSPVVIQWVMGTDELVIGTDSGEGLLLGGDEGITPATAQFRWRSTHGCCNIQPTRIEEALIFVQKSRQKIYEYFYEAASWQSPELSIASDHLFNQVVPSDAGAAGHYAGEAGVVQMAYQKDPHSLLYVFTKQGDLAVLSYDKKAGITGWTRFTAAGLGTYPELSPVAYGEGFFRSGCVLPNSQGEDEVWFQTTRWKADEGKYESYIEVLAKIDDPVFENRHYVDCGQDLHTSGEGSISSIAITDPITMDISINGTAPAADEHLLIYDISETLAGEDQALKLNGKVLRVVSISGTTVTLKFDGSIFSATATDTSNYLGRWKKVTKTYAVSSHLNDQTVQVTVDGMPHPDVTVADNSITLNEYAHHIHVGIGYKSKLRTMNLEVQAQSGSAVGALGKIGKCILRLYKSISVRVGRSERSENLERVHFVEWPYTFTQQEAGGTGDIIMDFPEGYDEDKYIYLEVDQPVACSVLGIIPIVDVYRG